MWPFNRKKKKKEEKKNSSYYSSYTPSVSDSTMFNPSVYNFDDDSSSHKSSYTDYGGGDFGGAGAGSSWSDSTSDSGGDSGGGDGGGGSD